MKSRKISSRDIVGCKILWELKLNCCKDSIRLVMAGHRAKLNHLLLSVLYGIERNVPAFRVGVGYCSLGAAIFFLFFTDSLMNW
jgi:hypothetical protein